MKDIVTTAINPYIESITSTSSSNVYFESEKPHFVTPIESTIEFKEGGKIVIDGIDITEVMEELCGGIIEQATTRSMNKVKPKPKDLIELVTFNKSLERTTVKWKDGTLTYVHCAADDELDLEKAIAMCFMKKAYGNRGCFNDFLKKWIDKVIIHE